MTEFSVAIIGNGPAGLFAAEACRQEGVAYKILGPGKPSGIFGAQYLHEPIPELTGKPQGVIEYKKIGTRDGYAHKVYGNMAMDVSWDTFDQGEREFWSLKEVYALAWIRHDPRIRPITVEAHDIQLLVNSYDLVINTAPKKQFCLKPEWHRFHAQKVYIDVQQRRQNGPNTIVYNGQVNVDWYRWSFIQGQSSYEYSRLPGRWKKEQEYILIHKPLNHTCDCHEAFGLNYLEVGRYGNWRKGELTHHAYTKTMERLYEVL